MIRVLVVDDNQNKINKIKDVLDSIQNCKFELAQDLVTARLMLQQSFDLLILDINLPERFNELAKENLGLRFIKEIRSSNRLKLPKHIIGLTEYDHIIEKYRDEFSNLATILVKYDNKASDWNSTIKEKIQYLIQAEVQDANKSLYSYDIAIVTALRTPEFDAVLDLEYNWEKIKFQGDGSTYYTGKISKSNGESLSVIATYLPQMGMVATAATTTKLILNFKPKYILISGICGGIKDKVNIGDLVIPDLSFDFGSGKVITDSEGQEKFQPDFKSIPISGDLKEELMDLASNRTLLRGIKDDWKGNSIQSEINLHIGPMGSGASVIENSDYTTKIIENQRKLLAIDMETYSVFYCCQYANNPRPTALSVKAVCDLADSKKNDNMQKFCSFISARLSDYIIKNILNF